MQRECGLLIAITSIQTSLKSCIRRLFICYRDYSTLFCCDLCHIMNLFSYLQVQINNQIILFDQIRSLTAFLWCLYVNYHINSYFYFSKYTTHQLAQVNLQQCQRFLASCFNMYVHVKITFSYVFL